MTGKGERERYTQLNAEFQRRARRHMKTLSEKCKEIEENDRKGKINPTKSRVPENSKER